MESKICLRCGNEYFKTYHGSCAKWRRRKYCSKRCYGDSKIGERINGIVAYCDNCGDEVYRTPATTLGHIFCSRKCMGEWQSKNRIGENNPCTGRPMALEQRLHLSRIKKGKKIKGGPRPLIRGENNPRWGKHHSEETIKKMSQAGKARWLCSEYVCKQMKSRGSRPNKKELWLERFLQEISLPYRYVGDGEFILGGKCPDFLNTNGQKKLIELYGDYFHRDENPQERIDYFADYGFHTLVIWEYELKNQDELEEKLVQFEACVGVK